MRSVYGKAVLLLVCWLWASSGYAVTLQQLTAHPVVADIKISPTGEYLALRIFRDGKHHVQFVSRESFAPLGSISFGGSREVGNYHWVNDERVVVEVLEAYGANEAPSNAGELFAANYDGSKSELIYGYRSGERQVGSRIQQKDADNAWAEIIDVLPDDKKRILIASTAWSRTLHDKPVALLLDTYSGKEKRQVMASRFPLGRFLTDIDGDVRLVTSLRPDDTVHLQALPLEADEWIDIPDSKYGKYFSPIAITDDKKSVYVLDNLNSDKIGLHKLSLNGSDYDEIYANKNVNISHLVMSTDDRSVIAIRIDNGYPSYLILPKPGQEAVTFKALLHTFSGDTVSIRSRSRDGRYWVVKTGSDVDAGSFHLFDRESNSILRLLDSRPDVKSTELASTEPVEFQSFDGRTIAGYYTRAKGSPEKIAPLVVLVHGGPIYRDYWGYDEEVQALATNGFSVLQVNFRGSAGYGLAFEEAGYLQWGNEIQKDIIAGTHWAIEQERATAGNICIMGASFGAYSAVQSSILEPNLYNCAVANAGIYDLSLLYTKGDIESSYVGDIYLEKVIGLDKAELAKFSPVTRIGELQAPVFIAHGKRDNRAPFEHAKRLKKELERYEVPFEWYVKSTEAHGFYNNDNQVAYLHAAIAFLNDHLAKN